MCKNDLNNLLKEFAELIISKIKEYQENKKFPKSLNEIDRTSEIYNDVYKIQHKRRNRFFQGTYDDLNSIILYLTNQDCYYEMTNFETDLRKEQISIKLCNKLSKHYNDTNITDFFHEILSPYFVTPIVYKYLNSNKNEDISLIDTCISNFSDILNESNLITIDKVWITGIDINDNANQLQITDDIVIRKTNKEEDLKDRGTLYQDLDCDLCCSLKDKVKVILELKGRNYKEEWKIQKRSSWLGGELQLILDLLILFKLGSVWFVKAKRFKELFEYVPNRNSLNIGMLLGPTNITYEYFINSNDLINLREFISKFKPLLSNKEISTALEFYREALKKESVSSQITYAVMCLEALCDTENELTRTLRQRISLLLGMLKVTNPEKYNDFSVNDIYKFIGYTYKIRSCYVHGSNPNFTADIELAKKILNYARISILLFIHLLSNSQYTARKKLNKELIDQALIDQNKYNELLKLIEPITQYIHH